MKRDHKRKSGINRVVIGGVLSSLSILFLICVAYSSWLIGAQGAGDEASMNVDTADVVYQYNNCFSIGAAQSGDNLQYYYSKDGSSNGLVYDEEIGDIRKAVFRLNFDLSSFRNAFSWAYIDFEFTLSYVDEITGLGLLNSNIALSLSRATNSTWTDLSQDSADESSGVYSIQYTNSSDSISSLAMISTYTFTVEGGASEAQSLSAISGAIFNIKASATQGSASFVIDAVKDLDSEAGPPLGSLAITQLSPTAIPNRDRRPIEVRNRVPFFFPRAYNRDGKEIIMKLESLKKYLAELLGTFVLTFVGCGTAVLICGSSAGGYVGTALAFGGAIVAMAYCVGNISGCHINPAVSLAMLLTKRMSLKDFLFYVLFQLIGGILAGLLLWLVFSNVEGCALGTNSVNAILGSENESATIGALFRGLLVEAVLTFIFVLSILGVTSKREFGSVAGLVIGGALTFVHLMGIGLTGTSVNPARSIGPALFAMINGVYEPIQQIWIFIVGPLLGAALAALVYNLVHRNDAKKAEEANKKPEETAE